MSRATVTCQTSSSCLGRNRRPQSRCWAMPDDKERDVAVNRRAYHDYFIDDKYEAGVMLTGTEVKSIRNGRANLRDGFGRIDNGEAWLGNGPTLPDGPADLLDPRPMRPRKLLLHRKEISSLIGKVKQKGYTLN